MESKVQTKLSVFFRKSIVVLVITAVFTWLVLQAVSATRVGDHKVIRDWMSLLLMPLLVTGIAVFWFRSERERESRQAALEREITADRQVESAYQAYVERITDLLLKDKLSKFSTEEVRNVARIRTLAVLREMDGRRKGSVLQFLKDSSLIDREAVIDLCGADLRGASLAYVSLGRVNLGEARLGEADLCGADLSKAFLGETDLSGSILSGANLSSADLFGANLTGATLNRANLSGANLTGANLTGCRLGGADLSGADLTGVNLNIGDLVGANLRGANLGGAELVGADLSEADLSRADLSGTRITQANLGKARSLEGAILPDGTKHD